MNRPSVTATSKFKGFTNTSKGFEDDYSIDDDPLDIGSKKFTIKRE